MSWHGKSLLAQSLGLLLVWLAGLAAPAILRAQGEPIADSGAPIAMSAPEASAKAAPPIEFQVQPTAFTTIQGTDGPVFRGQAPVGARPLPVGPSVTDGPAGPAPYNWRSASPTSASPQGPSLTNPASPTTGSTALPAPTPVPTDATPIVPVPVTSGMPGVPVGTPLAGGVLTGDGCCCPSACCPGSCCPTTCCPECCCPTTCCEGCCGQGNCFDDCCCGCYGSGNCFYANLEYLFWFVRGFTTPALVTRGSANDRIPGALGQPGTQVLYGGGPVDGGLRSGGRATVGWWFNEDHTLGVEAGGFFLGAASSNFSATSFGSPILGRPFQDATNGGAQTVELVAAPNVLSGTVNVRSTSAFNGAEINLRSNLCCGCNWYVDGLLGFRYLALTESLTISEALTVNPNAVPGGGSFNIVDRFATQNRFYGAQFGAYGEYRFGPWFVGVRGTLSLGTIEQHVNISGSTQITTPANGVQSFPGGLLTQSSNIGPHTRDVFGVVPEVGINLGYQISNHFRTYVGYNFIYLNSVMRPGNAVDTTVNPNLIPPANGLGGPQRPNFGFRGSDFWAQGVTFGIEFRY